MPTPCRALVLSADSVSWDTVATLCQEPLSKHCLTICVRRISSAYRTVPETVMAAAPQMP